MCREATHLCRGTTASGQPHSSPSGVPGQDHRSLRAGAARLLHLGLSHHLGVGASRQARWPPTSRGSRAWSPLGAAACSAHSLVGARAAHPPAVGLGLRQGAAGSGRSTLPAPRKAGGSALGQRLGWRLPLEEARGTLSSRAGTHVVTCGWSGLSWRRRECRVSSR